MAKCVIAVYGNEAKHPIDAALLALLDDGDCYAFNILSRSLRSWEISQIKARLEKETNAGPTVAAKAGKAAGDEGKEAADEAENSVGNAGKPAGKRAIKSPYPLHREELEKELNNLIVGVGNLSEEFPGSDSAMANTGHLLLYILRSKKYASSKILSMYNIMQEEVVELLSQLPADENSARQQRPARNIHIVHISPPAGMMPPIDMGTGEDSGEEYLSEGQDEEEMEEAGIATRTNRAVGLEKYGIDLTKAALTGKIDPVIGREKEIERLIQILGRCKKNNPVLIGEAGVGKSAIAEGLALKLVSRDVPASLYGKRLFSLDISSLVAGTKYRGQFEERIKNFMQELARNKNTILFIDEIHTIVGAGSTQGALDTANILKPALARGEIQCIGATTLDEYRESIEKDGALERRFQKIIVEPASKAETLEILNNIKDKYEAHHNVRYTDEAVKECVELAERYITSRYFPDKAIDLLDEAGSKANLAGPVAEHGILKELHEALSLAGKEKRRAAADLNYRKAANARMREVALADKIKEIRLEGRKRSAQNAPTITDEHIRDVVASMTGIPVQSVSKDEKTRLREIEKHLSSVVIGQGEAISKVSKSIQRSRAGLKDPGKPIGVFMFAGPTGVGKTLLAKELSKWMFGRGDALIRIDMSEYSEKHNVSRLIGSPPGYVGYNEGGQLTEAVRRQPYAVILFDEIEKAHPDLFNVMLQIFDEGQLTDGNGRKVDFRNTVIIMTSNVGSRTASAKAPVIGYGAGECAALQADNDRHNYRHALEAVFAPEFINRIDDIAVFGSLSLQDIKQIVELELGYLYRRSEALGIGLRIGAKVKNELACLGHDPKYGARSLKRLILEKIEEPLAELLINEDIAAGEEIVANMKGDKIILSRKIALSRRPAGDRKLKVGRLKNGPHKIDEIGFA